MANITDALKVSLHSEPSLPLVSSLNSSVIARLKLPLIRKDFLSASAFQVLVLLVGIYQSCCCFQKPEDCIWLVNCTNVNIIPVICVFYLILFTCSC